MTSGQSIRARLISLAIISILVSATTILLLAANQHENLYRKSVIEHMQGLSANLADDIFYLLTVNRDPISLNTRLLVLERYPQVHYARVYDNQWQLLQQYVNPNYLSDQAQGEMLSPEVAQGLSKGTTLSGPHLINLQPIGETTLPQGYLLVVSDYSERLADSHRTLLLQSLPTMLGVLLLVIAWSLAKYRKILKPLETLSAVLTRVGQTNDYSLRCRVEGDDEVAELSRTVNVMLHTIEEQSERNELYTRKLVEQQESMERLANFDVLTGLPNRQFFAEMLRFELANGKRGGSDIVIMFCDLDGFKAVNDTLGPEVGDLLLKSVANRLRTYLREGDVLARLGADEFVVLFAGESDMLVLQQVAERIAHGMQEPFGLDRWEVMASLSMGLASASGAKWDSERLLSNADIAMHQAKKEGDNSCVVFADSMIAGNKRRLDVASQLSYALSADEFYILYQPKVDKDIRVVGFEALIRWQSSKLGFVSPAEFIPVAERSGKIRQITQWVVERVFRDLPQIIRLCGQDICVSLNLSTHDLKSNKLLEQITSLYQQYNIRPQNIEFEVTESAYIDQFERAEYFFKEVREMGSSIALDDFGTGFSSLGYLTQISIETLKIDKQFIDNVASDPKHARLTETIIAMARNLELNICAEGVETIEQEHFLLALGVDQMQGYFYSKPIDIDDIPSLIRELAKRRS